MTITFLQPDGVAITAQQFRQAQAATHGGGSGRRLGLRSGFRVDTPSTVLTATSTTWTLTPCAAEIDPGASTHQGGYGWATDANVTGSVTAADATYARKDIVYIQVNDSSAGDGSGALTAPVLYLAGTPAATPVAPTLPARSFLVGTISVPIAGGGSPTVVLNPARYVAAGGILPVYTLTERDALTKSGGLAVARMDKGGRIELCDGTDWAPHSGVVGYFDRESDVAFNTGESVILTAAAPLVAGHRYRVTVAGRCYSTAGGVAIDYGIRVGVSGLTGTQKGAGIQVPGSVTPESFAVVADWNQSSTDLGAVVTFTAKVTGAALATIAAAAGRPLTLTVEDLGGY